jgi:menaquinone-dependent protoporphyrinogen oxidase
VSISGRAVRAISKQLSPRQFKPRRTLNILLIHSTIDGHTLKICRHIAERLAAPGVAIGLRPLAETSRAELEAADTIIIGASIRYGHHRPELLALLRDHADLLELRAVALFCVNLVARKPDKNRPQTNPYMRRVLAQLSWKPQVLAVFAGKIDYPRYGFIDRQIIRLVMWLTDGPCNGDESIDFTDWREVEAFAEAIRRLPACDECFVRDCPEAVATG